MLRDECKKVVKVLILSFIFIAEAAAVDCTLLLEYCGDPKVRPLFEQIEYEAAAAVLARSLADGQLNYIIPDDALQFDRITWLMQKIVKASSYKGTIVANREGPIRGVAIWHHSDETPSFWDEVRSGLRAAPLKLPLKSAFRLQRLSWYLNYVKDVYCEQGCYYLYFLGIDPEFQGLGLARALIEPAIRVSERNRIPLYLETQKLENVTFYKQFDFETVYQGKEASDAPISYVMMRIPN
jgi:ribosomal protein S18 acetylase RimI-like enzyme